MIGVLGGGQLGRMLALAGYPLGLQFRFFDPAREPCVAALAEVVQAEYEDEAALERFAAGLDVVTYEFESVPVSAAHALAKHAPVYPPPVALATAQDRWPEKSKFRDLGIPTPSFQAIDSQAQLEEAVASLGLPAVLKTRRNGYDGKGQFVLRQRGDIDKAWRELGDAPLILEVFVPFEREISILTVRGQDGAQAFYPLVENVHQEGILRTSRVLERSAPLQALAEQHARRLLEDLDYVGVLAVEFFVREGQLLANEMAPRVHNSGHWTIEGAETSQFENHLRAVLGWPLGATLVPRPVALVNLIGAIPEPASLLTLPGVHLHDYGKKPRPGRKVGHVTVLADDPRELEARVRQVQALIGTPAHRELCHTTEAT